jgi:hypothetical protein
MLPVDVNPRSRARASGTAKVMLRARRGLLDAPRPAARGAARERAVTQAKGSGTGGERGRGPPTVREMRRPAGCGAARDGRDGRSAHVIGPRRVARTCWPQPDARSDGGGPRPQHEPGRGLPKNLTSALAHGERRVFTRPPRAGDTTRSIRTRGDVPRARRRRRRRRSRGAPSTIRGRRGRGVAWARGSRLSYEPAADCSCGRARAGGTSGPGTRLRAQT